VGEKNDENQKNLQFGGRIRGKRSGGRKKKKKNELSEKFRRSRAHLQTAVEEKNLAITLGKKK